MKNVMIMGSTGMVGNMVLKECLNRDDVSRVTIIVRRTTMIVHPKLVEVIHDDFMNYSSIIDFLKDIDVLIFCIGVYTGQVPSEEFKKITIDYTKIFAETIKTENENVSFCFLSGAGADSKEKSKVLFSREKGKAENILLSMEFDNLFIFRPGYIYPTIPRKEPNFSYTLSRILYKIGLLKISKSLSITSKDLGHAMVENGLNNEGTIIFENKDIITYLNNL